MVGRETNAYFVRRYWVSEVKYLDMSARSPDYEHLVLDVHGVTSILEFHRSQWGGRSEVPILDLGQFPSVSNQMLRKKRIELDGKKDKLVPLAFCPSYPWQGSLLEAFQTTSRT